MLINLTSENILLLGSILVFCSILISKTGYKFGMPALLMFLLVGMFFGSDGLGLQFGNAGQAQFIGMMALSVILFTGGMDTKLKEIRPVIYPGVLLSTVGVLLTTLLTGLFIFFISARHLYVAYGVAVACRHDVVDRLGICFQHIALAENEFALQFAPDA